MNDIDNGSRIILAPNDVLTPFDLRAQNFRVIVEFSTCHRGQIFFFEKMSESDLSARKKKFELFFETTPFGSLMIEKISKTFFSSRRGPFGKFFQDFSGKDGYQTTPF